MTKSPLKRLLTSKTFAYSAPFVNFFAVLGLILLATCQSEPDGDSIIGKSIAVHGGDHLENVDLSFQFRDKKYGVHRDDGRYRYERIFSDSIGNIRDILHNDGFERQVNGSAVEVSPEFQRRYANSVNSVVYFALLPFGLDGKAVNKKFLGETTIKGKPYYEIMVTFDEEGGGEDHEDVYVYWINQQNHRMDYLAYAFHTEGGGSRFREAINPRTVGGILFQDFINYDYKGDTTDLHAYEVLFEENKLEEISRIVLENIMVEG